MDTIQNAVAARGRALIVLTGGGNGIGLLQYLAKQGNQIDWSKVDLFWGDERYVPEDDDERNEKQAREALLDHIDIPSSHVHAMPPATVNSAATWPPRRSPTSRCWPQTPHPASSCRISTSICWEWVPRATSTRLFPDTAAVLETTRMVVAVEDSPKPPPQRITLTLPAIQRSREVWLMVSGAGKADAVAGAIGGAPPVSIPAAGAIGLETTLWLLDKEAAAKLPGQSG